MQGQPLQNGPSGLELRRLTAEDAVSLRAHLLRLDTYDRFMRFCNVMDDARIERFVDTLDWPTIVLIGYVDGEHLRGVVQLSVLDEDRGSAEFAISVDRQHRGIGLARELMNAALSHARSSGLASLTMTSLSDNDAILRLARQLGFKLSANQQQTIGELAL